MDDMFGFLNTMASMFDTVQKRKSSIMNNFMTN